MTAFLIVLGIVSFILLVVIIISYICFRLAFFDPRKKEDCEGFSLPDGEIYKAYSDVMKGWSDEAKKLNFESFTVKSFDGLTLCAKYYEYKKGAPIELMLHGYRGRAERDLCGGVQRCFSLGRNAFIVDQRACGKSEGKVISFGINEKRDCLAWVDFINNHFGKETQIILAGISMGASTVLMAANPWGLPPCCTWLTRSCREAYAGSLPIAVLPALRI